jgi:hypothetical protein
MHGTYKKVKDEGTAPMIPCRTRSRPRRHHGSPGLDALDKGVVEAGTEAARANSRLDDLEAVLICRHILPAPPAAPRLRVLPGGRAS